MEERGPLTFRHNQGKLHREIAKIMNRSHSTTVCIRNRFNNENSISGKIKEVRRK